MLITMLSCRIVVAAFGDPGAFMATHADAVADAVQKVVSKALGTQEFHHLVVDVVTADARAQLGKIPMRPASTMVLKTSASSGRGGATKKVRSVSAEVPVHAQEGEADIRVLSISVSSGSGKRCGWAE